MPGAFGPLVHRRGDKLGSRLWPDRLPRSLRSGHRHQGVVVSPNAVLRFTHEGGDINPIRCSSPELCLLFYLILHAPSVFFCFYQNIK